MSQMQIPCNNCGKVFTPTPGQARFVSTANAKGMRLIMLQCQLCGITTGGFLRCFLFQDRLKAELRTLYASALRLSEAPV